MGSLKEPAMLSLTWLDIAWLRSITQMPLVLKGIMTGEEAALAVEHGVNGIIVSNHGGRQVDGTLATIEVLPEVVDRVAGRIEVLLDGGVRRRAERREPITVLPCFRDRRSGHIPRNARSSIVHRAVVCR